MMGSLTFVTWYPGLPIFTNCLIWICAFWAAC